jgi:hypothetical protein
MYGFTDLVGKTIEQVSINDDKTQLTFSFANGERIHYYADGDCCSESWIEHIANHEALIGATVIKTEDVELGEISPPSRQECERQYGYKIFTTKGLCDIDMRNASNGYYGGSICRADWFKPTDTKPITEDF